MFMFPDKPEDKGFMLLVSALSDAHKKGLDDRLDHEPV